MEIKLIEDQAKGYAIAKENEEQAGKITYSVDSADFIIIDHTEVSLSFRDKDVGKQLLYKIMEVAREKNIKIMPLCPFAAAMFKKLTDI